MFENLYPYSDFHEMNLDWVIKTVKELIDKWMQTAADWKTQQEAFNDLKAYIENYFNNLDLSQEVSDKINEMIANGTMTTIIQNIYGTRLGVEIVDNVSDMTDPAKVYILSSDPNGYLYFWDGSQFEASSISYFNPINALSFISGTITDLDNLYRQVVMINSVDLPNVAHTPPNNTIGLIVIDLSTSSTSSVQIAYQFAQYSDPIFFIRKKSSNTWSQWFKNNALDYIEFVSKYVSGDDLDNLNRGITKVESSAAPYVQNVPITTKGVIVTDLGVDNISHVQIAYGYSQFDQPLVWIRKNSTGNSWSDWREITGNLWGQITNENLNDITYPCTVFWNTSDGLNVQNNPLRMIAGYVKTYIGLPKANLIQELGSWSNPFNGVKAVRVKQSNSSPWSAWNIINADFANTGGYGFTVIGDSVSCGTTTRTVGGVTTLFNFNMESWEKILANRIGCKLYSCSRAGASTSNWLDASNNYGYKKLNMLPATPVYMINLGLNDYNQTISESDFKANYKSIIEMCKAKAPNAIILCFKLWRSGVYDTYSQYIEDLLTSDYSSDDRVVFFDIQSDVLSSPINNHLYNGHFDVIGYKLIADAVEAEFMNFANAHPDLFRYEFSMIVEGSSYQDNGYPYTI